MEVSKKKKAEFDEIFKQIDKNNFYINISLLRNLYESDFYQHFLYYIDIKIINHIKLEDTIILHADINLISIKDTCYYQKILEFSKLLHKYTLNIKKIIVYNNSSLFSNFINLINIGLGSNISNKIFFSNDKQFNINNDILTNNLLN